MDFRILSESILILGDKPRGRSPERSQETQESVCMCVWEGLAHGHTEG